LITFNADIDVCMYSKFTHFACFSYCSMFCLCESSQHWAALCTVQRPLLALTCCLPHWFWASFHLWRPSLHCVCENSVPHHTLVYLIIPLSSPAKCWHWVLV